MGKILVMGGTGAIGIHLVPELQKLNHIVHVTTREKQCNDKTGRALYIHGNARCANFIKHVLSKTRYDAVVDLMQYDTNEFLGIHKTILAQTGQYLFVSSTRIFADSGDLPITEKSKRLLDVSTDAGFLATDSYALSKARQEDVLSQSRGKNWTILRPSITYSTNRFQLATLDADTVCFRSMQDLPVIIAREILEKKTSMTWAGNTAQIVGKLVLNEKTFGEDYNIATNEHRTWKEVADYYKEFLSLTYVTSDLDMYTKVAGEKYAMIYDRMFHRIFDNSKVLQAAGLAQNIFVSLREGLKMELENFTLDPNFKKFDLLLNARLDHATNSRISLKGLNGRTRLRYHAERNPLLRNLVSARKSLIDRLRREKKDDQ